MISEDRESRTVGSCRPPSSAVQRGSSLSWLGSCRRWWARTGARSPELWASQVDLHLLTQVSYVIPGVRSNSLQINLLSSSCHLWQAPKTWNAAFKKKLFISFWLHWVSVAARAFSSCSEQGPFIVRRGLLMAGASRCGAQALGTRASVAAAAGSVVVALRL